MSVEKFNAVEEAIRWEEPEEMGERTVDELAEKLLNDLSGKFDTDLEHVTGILRKLEERGRRRGVEEAANVVEKYAPLNTNSSAWALAHEIANHLRANAVLAPRDSGKEGA